MPTPTRDSKILAACPGRDGRWIMIRVFLTIRLIRFRIKSESKWSRIKLVRALVIGAFKNENGLWDQSCLHLDIRNYTLEVWSGYYKSIRAMAYCDATFGPILMRSSVLDKIEVHGLNLLNFTIADRLVLFTANPDLRVIHCPDCMFYTKSRPTVTKESLLKAARRLQVTEIRIEQAEFTYT